MNQAEKSLARPLLYKIKLILRLKLGHVGMRTRTSSAAPLDSRLRGSNHVNDGPVGDAFFP